MPSSSKEFPLSITLRTIDKASPGIARLNASIERASGPFKRLGKEFGSLRENLGLPRMAEGFRSLGAQVRGVATGLGIVGAAAGLAGLAFKGIVDEFDGLATRAERIGITVNAMAQLEHAAARSDVEVGELDGALGSFSKNLGMASAGTGKLHSFLKKVSPTLLTQVKGAKDFDEALGLMADAMVKVKNPAQRTALAVAAFGGAGAAMIPLLTKGSAGIAELREEFAKSAGSQQEAADAAGAIDDAFKKLKPSIASVKASLLVGLGPAFLDITQRAGAFISENRERIAEWARDFGEKLPARIATLMATLKQIRDEAIVPVVNAISWLVDKLGGAESAMKLLIAGFLTFKAIQVGSAVAGIVGGLAQIATAAGAARAALLATNAAAGGGLAGAGAKVGGALLGGGALAAGAAAATGAAALGVGAGMGLDALVGMSGRSLSDRMASVGGGSVGGVQLFDRKMIRGAVGAGAFSRPSLGAASVGAVGSRSEAHVVVELKGAPPGTRATIAPGTTADLDVDVGYQGLGSTR